MQASIISFDFFFGGNAIFTVKNNKGVYYTFKITKAKDKDDLFFAGLLTGSDNESSYTYMGLAIKNDPYFVFTKKSNYTDYSKPVLVFKWALGIIKNQKKLPEGYGILHEGKCCKCGKTLTTPESILKGIGPKCEHILMATI